MPLTESGKVDRTNLPRPAPKVKSVAAAVDRPVSEMEVILAKIWEELLEIDDVERDDMFFDLGGHSLLAINVVSRFAQETGIHIPVANLIYQTLRQLAALAEASTDERETNSGNREPANQRRNA